MQVDPQDEVADRLHKYRWDPLGHALWTYPWGEPGELAPHSGPRAWQREELEAIGRHLSDPSTRHTPYLSATASGHGIGKSALVSWLVRWAVETCPDCKVVLTANTEPQLRTKTWPEVAKWSRLSMLAPWFDCTATAIANKDPNHAKTWRADAITWSENNTEAFAGLHNQGRRVVLIFDEASAISDKVWEVAEGALTDSDTEILWFVFGNPTLNTGRFRECFGRLKHRWRTRQVDSRTVEGTNRTQLDQWIADYGEDSDFARVRIKGQFPRAGSAQFVSSEIVDLATKREAISIPADPLVCAVDVARFGEDESVIFFRRGRDARSISPVVMRGADTMQVAARVCEESTKYGAEAVFIDETGVGGGVVDRCRMLGLTVTGVNNGGRVDNPLEGMLLANKGAECWARMREWLKGGAIQDDPDLRQQLEGREYGFNTHNEIVLEKKADMKKRGLSSPDRADALALTFSYPVVPRAMESDSTMRQYVRSGTQHTALREYDPFAKLRR